MSLIFCPNALFWFFAPLPVRWVTWTMMFGGLPLSPSDSSCSGMALPFLTSLSHQRSLSSRPALHYKQTSCFQNACQWLINQPLMYTQMRFRPFLYSAFQMCLECLLRCLLPEVDCDPIKKSITSFYRALWHLLYCQWECAHILPSFFAPTWWSCIVCLSDQQTLWKYLPYS